MDNRTVPCKLQQWDRYRVPQNVFLFKDNLLCCADYIVPPMIMSVTDSSVTMTCRLPADASSSKVALYVIKYRKVGSNSWNRMKESTGVWQTVSGLEANTRYEFRLVARYQGESSTMESKSATVKTSRSKCVLMIFPYSVSQFKLPLRDLRPVSITAARCVAWRAIAAIASALKL